MLDIHEIASITVEEAILWGNTAEPATIVLANFIHFEEI